MNMMNHTSVIVCHLKFSVSSLIFISFLVLGLDPGHIQDLVVEIVFILEITAEITEIIEE